MCFKAINLAADQIIGTGLKSDNIFLCEDGDAGQQQRDNQEVRLFHNNIWMILERINIVYGLFTV